MWRLMMMASMITSTGYLIPLLFSPSVDLFSGKCSSLCHQLLYCRHQLLAEAEAQYLAYGHGLVGGVYAAAPVVPEVKTVEVKAAPVVSYAAGVVPSVSHYAAGVVPAAHVFAAPAVPAELYGPFQLAPPQHYRTAGAG